MSKRLLIGAMSVIMTVGMVGASMADQLKGRRMGPNPGFTPVGDHEILFKGDLGPDLGIGCSNVTGGSGGPNDVAVALTSSMPPPVVLTSHQYNIYTNVSPNITALSCVVWSQQPPFTEIARRTGLDWTQNATNTMHTYHIVPAMFVPVSAFYFGHNQPQTNVGIRWGLDTSSGAPCDSFIRAPVCGANSFTLLSQLGYPGNWTMTVGVAEATPVELRTWGNVKAQYEQ